ncbi:MAG TPA: universal stress protein [Steroidobacteraceae bacterium]|nr:universal stress protein [Steroidobacteraceae bacterium]
MFKRVLLCYDGSQAGRRALKRGAELAIMLGAEVHVLSIIPRGKSDPAVIAGAVGYPCLVNERADYRQLLDQSTAWLKERGVVAEGILAAGEPLEQIAEYAKRLAIDLIVLGHYPQPSGGLWWSGPQRRATLSERVNCCIFVAVSADDDPVPARSATG